MPSATSITNMNIGTHQVTPAVCMMLMNTSRITPSVAAYESRMVRIR